MEYNEELAKELTENAVKNNYTGIKVFLNPTKSNDINDVMEDVNGLLKDLNEKGGENIGELIFTTKGK
jgi:hypothetical protein